MNNDLISREDLKKELEKVFFNDNDDMNRIEQIIDNAPSIDVIPNEEGYEMYNKGYMSGYEMAKKNIIHSIAKQYSAHNELVPIWLSIGDIKGGAENE